MTVFSSTCGASALLALLSTSVAHCSITGLSGCSIQAYIVSQRSALQHDLWRWRGRVTAYVIAFAGRARPRVRRVSHLWRGYATSKSKGWLHLRTLTLQRAHQTLRAASSGHRASSAVAHLPDSDPSPAPPLSLRLARPFVQVRSSSSDLLAIPSRNMSANTVTPRKRTRSSARLARGSDQDAGAVMPAASADSSSLTPAIKRTKGTELSE